MGLVNMRVLVAWLGWRLVGLGLLVSLPIGSLRGQTPSAVYSELPVHDALSALEWRRVDASVDHGLEFLASQQEADGSFPSRSAGQPGVTSLSTMAFLSRGHRPGVGPYGEVIERAIDFVLSCQEEDGMIVHDKLRLPSSAAIAYYRAPHTATYNHAISGLLLGEAYGQGDDKLNAKLRPAIELALDWARKMQLRPPRYPEDLGGWRYRHPADADKPLSDLSVTGWFIMFYRSARNAEFVVPEIFVKQAADFVEKSYDPKSGAFYYGPNVRDHTIGRGMTGAGLLTLAVCGRRDEKIARAAGMWILDHPFDSYNKTVGVHDRYHYGAYYCSQAMYLLGGEYWRRFYPVLSKNLIDNQQNDGGWPHEAGHNDRQFGRCYSSSLAVLSLTPPYQLLPIYQR